MFRLIHIAHGWGCVSGVRIFKFQVRGIPQVLDPLRNGSALMVRTALIIIVIMWFKNTLSHSQ